MNSVGPTLLAIVCVGAVAIAVFASPMVVDATLATSRARRTLRPSTARHLPTFPNWLMVVAGAVLAWMVDGLILAGVVAGGATAAVVLVRRSRQQRRRARYNEALPRGLDAVARSLRSGAGIRTALAEAASATGGEVGNDLRVVVNQVEMGSLLRDALADWPRRRPEPGVRLTAAALVMALESGASTARAVDSAALTIRASLNSINASHTHATQARTSAWVLALLPILVTSMNVTFSDGAHDFLLHSPAGAVVLLIGGALDVAGAFVMQRMIIRSTR